MSFHDEKMKIVHFHEYCDTCKYKDLAGDAEPCGECLTYPGRYDSHKPIKYEQDEEK